MMSEKYRLPALTSLFMLASLAGCILSSTSLATAEDNKADWTSAVLQNRYAAVLPAVRSAAASNDASALEIEAAMYDRGCGVVQSMVHAADLYAKAVSHGAKDGLASGYSNLYGSISAEDLGLSQLNQAAEGGDVLAAFDLYFYYIHRLGNRSEDSTAFRWASFAAHSGDAVAAADLAGLYLDGSGVEQNPALGRQYAERGVLSNIPDGLLISGLQMLHGSQGVPKDRDKGFLLLRKAVSLGLTRAKIAIVMNADKSDFADGRITQSEATAFAQDAAAVMKPSEYYDYALAEYWYIGGGRDVPDCARALPLLLGIADNNLVERDYDIGYCYYSGDGVPQNRELAYKYMKLAALKGSPNAIALLNSSNSGQSDNSSNVEAESWHNYEGYHWSELHPMSGQPATGPH